MISSRITELKLKKRELTLHLSELRRDIVYRAVSERNKRNILRKIRNTEEKIEQIEIQIGDEKSRFLRQKQVQTVNTFTTPPSHVVNKLIDPPENVSIEDMVEEVPSAVIVDLDPPRTVTISEQASIFQPTSAPINSASMAGGAIPKNLNLLPSYEFLKRREMEEKNEKLQRELKETKDRLENMLKNSLLVPTNNKTLGDRQAVKRNFAYDSYELKKPLFRLNSLEDPRVDERNKFSTIEELPNTQNISLNGGQTTPFQTYSSTRQTPGVNRERNEIPQRNDILRDEGIQMAPPNFPQQNRTNELAQDNFITPVRVLQNNFTPGTQAPQNVQIRNDHENFDNQNRNRIAQRSRASFVRRLKMIPMFNGGSYNELRDFIDVVDTIYVSIQDANEENEFYEQLLIQIRGEARSALTSLNGTEWPDIREKLKSYFSYMANKDIINSKLENLRQEKNETLNEFVDRTRKLLQEK